MTGVRSKLRDVAPDSFTRTPPARGPKPGAILPPAEVRLTEAGLAALRWMHAHGGDVAVARVRGGGRYFLGQGEQAPFMPRTARQLIDAGLAEYVDENGRKAVRFRLTGGSV